MLYSFADSDNENEKTISVLVDESETMLNFIDADISTQEVSVQHIISSKIYFSEMICDQILSYILFSDFNKIYMLFRNSFVVLL